MTNKKLASNMIQLLTQTCTCTLETKIAFFLDGGGGGGGGWAGHICLSHNVQTAPPMKLTI